MKCRDCRFHRLIDWLDPEGDSHCMNPKVYESGLIHSYPQHGGFFCTSPDFGCIYAEVRNEEKMEGPHPWSDPPKEKLSELSIGCPACNDTEHKMLIVYSLTESYIYCEKCHVKFRLVGTKMLRLEDTDTVLKIL